MSKKFYTKWQKDKLVFKVRETDATLGAVCTTSPTLIQLKEKLEKYVGIQINDKVKLQKTQLCAVLDVVARSTDEFQRAMHLASK